MTFPKKEIQKWIDALRSGKYEQGKGALQSSPDSYCCLGVACRVLSPRYYTYSDGMLGGGLPAVEFGAPQWLADINKDFGLKTTGVTLDELNDKGGFTFDEIADLLQAVYIEEVLEVPSTDGEKEE